MYERILIVDDEEDIRDSVSYILRQENYDVSTAPNGSIALKLHLNNPFDIVVTDIEMPEMKGPELIDRILHATPETFIILITAFASIDTAISALRKGVFDYIIKPIDFDDLLHRINKLKHHRRLSLENVLLKKEINRQYDFQNIVGKSEPMKKIFAMIERLAHSPSNVLILGKSGTGKELIARALHFNGNRRDKPFIPINCGAIVDTLFESELFGHKKGAFTNALSDKIGLFAVADGGTIFLDEVSEIPLHLQVKLLRAIEQREIYPVGYPNPINVDVRIIASTHKDLSVLVEEGKFREDLYYRLNVVQIKIPSLSEREEDISLLAHHFVQKYSKQMNKVIRGIDNKVMLAIMNHHWKGEVRELENAIERAVIFAESDMITIADLPESVKGNLLVESDIEIQPLESAIGDFEKKYIIKVLELCNYDKEKATKILNISTSTLYRRMQEYNIEFKRNHADSKEQFS